MVERVEVVVNRLHLLAFQHREAKPQEDVFQFAHRGAQHMQPAHRLGRGAGQRHVDRVGLQALIQLARVEQLPRAPRSACSNARLASLAALPTSPALLGLERGDQRSICGSSALRPR